MTDSDGKPNPGSELALSKGCKCPVLGNNHGRGNHRGSYTINLECPIHGDIKP